MSKTIKRHGCEGYHIIFKLTPVDNSFYIHTLGRPHRSGVVRIFLFLGHRQQNQRRMHRLTLTTVLLSAVGRSLAQNATTPSATDCVDPSGMASCLSNANSKLSTCINEAGGNDNIIIACGWGKDVDEMVCYQQSCWNKVITPPFKVERC